MPPRTFRFHLLATLLLGSLGAVAHAVTWFPFGPDGGDARSLAADPRDHAHLFLGTATGWIYESHDEGLQWKRLARVGGNRDDLVIDNIGVDAADPRHLLVGAWVVDRPDGGLYASQDGGQTWASETAMRGQSIRALAQSPSNPKLWVAGTLTGVVRSEDNGAHWLPISPKDSTEIHEVESIAIDPKDPGIIYAGTWHLPWKTKDGGAHWENIKEGVIDDSDVFSIIVDKDDPATVYVSACSGIYKSENAGGRFQKVEGIPSEARRTRVLMQDPRNHDVVFAGTTEGLFRTGDAGKIWIRMTGPEVIVNDVYIDPKDSNRLLIATDRGGVLLSDDGGTSFRPANKGFSARHLSAFAADAQHPATVYVGALNDKQWGGVFRSENGGLTWQQQSVGLNGSDVFSLAQAPDGTLIAGTGHGFFRLKDGVWDNGTRIASQPERHGPTHRVHPVAKAKSVPHTKITAPAPGPAQNDLSVFAMVPAGESLFAATSNGLLNGGRAGATWTPSSGLPAEPFYFLAAVGEHIASAGLKTIGISGDGGKTWRVRTGPAQLAQLTALAVDSTGTLYVGGREGIFLSADDGASWQVLPGLIVNDVNSILFDARAQRILITTAGRGTMGYSVQLPQRRVTFFDTGWNLRFLRPVGEYLVGITPFDGVVVQPRMVDSAENARP